MFGGREPTKPTSAFDHRDDLRLHPAYSVAEAAHYVRMPEATLRSWVAGRPYPASGIQHRSQPVIHLDDRKRRLKRIERDARGLPIRLYPFTRATGANAAPVSDPRVVVMAATISFGRPVIAGTGIPVSAIYERHKAGDSVAELAHDFRLQPCDIEEAIRCETAWRDCLLHHQEPRR